MITPITPHISIGEFSDIIYGDDALKHIDAVYALRRSGITSVINMREIDDEREQVAFREAWRKGYFVRYYYCPVPIDCGDCTVYIANRGQCKSCPKNAETLSKDNKFLQGLELAFLKLASILYDDYQENVLLHCTAGLDRSPFVVAKYLCEKVKSVPDWDKQHKRMNFHFFKNMTEAYAFIKTKRPQICEHPEWIWWKE
jgi:hypothetical protein